MPPADPTTPEWVAAAVAAGLVVVLGGLHLLRAVLARSAATAWGRLAGLLLAVLAVGLVLVVVVLGVAGAQASDGPTGEFAAVLVHPEADTASRLAGYAAALLLPLAAALAILAVAVVDVGRGSGLRIAAGVASGLVMAIGALVSTGGTDGAALAAGWAAVVLGAAAAAALVADQLDARERNGEATEAG